MIPFGPDDPFEEIIREQTALMRLVKRTETKETPLYSKGTFDPTLVGAGTPGTFTYNGSATECEWTRSGNRLYYNGRITITATAVAPTGNMSIQGWPFTFVADSVMAIAGVGVLEWATIDMPAGFTSISLQFNNATTTAFLIRSGDNVGQAIVQGAELVGGVYEFRFGGNYRML